MIALSNYDVGNLIKVARFLLAQNGAYYDNPNYNPSGIVPLYYRNYLYLRSIIAKERERRHAHKKDVKEIWEVYEQSIRNGFVDKVVSN